MMVDEYQYAIIQKSKLFDEKWFCKVYSVSSDMDPIVYYLENCLKLNPSPQFDTQWYLETYPDVKNAKVNPLIHYIEHGKKEFRLPKPYLFDSKYKREYSIIFNSDLFDEIWFSERYSINPNINPIIYYLENCLKLELDPSPNFNTKLYLNKHPELKNDNINPFVHYILNKKSSKIVKIGVFGCCLSRDAFNSRLIHNYKDFFEINVTGTRISMISLMQNPINIDEEYFKIFPINKSNNYKTSCIINDVKRTFLKSLLEKDIEYLIIDNYLEVVFGIICFDEGIISYSTDLIQTNFFKELQNYKHFRIMDLPDKYFELWSNSCKKFFDFIEKKCPNLKIILNKAKPTDKILKADGSVYIDPAYTKHVQMITPHLNRLDSYIESNYDVKIIEYDDDYYLDENHMWGKGPEHYTKIYYQDYMDKLKKIIIDDYYDEITQLSSLNNKLNQINDNLNKQNQKLLAENKIAKSELKNLK